MQQWHREEGHDPTTFSHAPHGDVRPLVSMCGTKLRAVPNEAPLMLCPICARLLDGNDTITIRQRSVWGTTAEISD